MRAVACALSGALLVCAGAWTGCGHEPGAGTPVGVRLSEPLIQARAAAQRDAAAALGAEAGKQILFGDLHVHSSFSIDAFMLSLPVLQGDGVHPVSDACDFARYCSGLDFWSINDHAESLTPLRWRQTKEAIRQCNAIAGDPERPDVVAFLGWEWTQVGTTPETHYGHKNVVLRDIEEDAVPRRPISAAGFTGRQMRKPPPLIQRIMLPLVDPSNYQIYLDLLEFQAAIARVPDCPADVDTRALPDECLEGAATPTGLFEKLSRWGFPALVIPHGTTWGIYTPAGSSWDKQLAPAEHDPERQRLIEVFSGHGNSEEYRSWIEIERGETGAAACPSPQGSYEPCCWRAGEIIRSRCTDPAASECEERVMRARVNFLAAGAAGRLTIPDAPMSAWGDCGSCPDCYLPAMNYRPRSSVQYIMALSRRDETGGPHGFDFGFIASSDNHRARAGTGYKEFGRLINTEAHGPRDERVYRSIYGELTAEPARESVAFDEANSNVPGFRVVDFERQASFFMTGGLVAVHAAGRDRQGIWDALMRREVYGTSGPRILLWFELLNARGGAVPMGGRADVDETPRFRVRAAGAFEQAPGCPADAAAGLPAERLERLCRGECYNPTERRQRIDRIEVVRIRRQNRAGEPVEPLIEDPWKVLRCQDAEGCSGEFDDPEFPAGGRETLYYVRAIQEPALAVNAGALRCRRDQAGRCLEIDPCYGDYRTPADDDCLAANEERAWSSPIFLSPTSP